MKKINVHRVFSCVSGSTVQMISRELEISPESVLIGTMNTNVEYGKGIIHIFSDYRTRKLSYFFCHQLKKCLEGLGVTTFFYTHGSIEEVIKSVVSVGSMNAIDTKALELMWEESQNPPLRKWLEDVACGNETTWCKYVETKAGVLENKLGYSKNEANELAIKTFESTVQSLLQSEGLNEKSFESHIKKVTTPNGCTEKGIFFMTDTSFLFSAQKFWSIIEPIYSRANQFESDAMNSILI